MKEKTARKRKWGDRYDGWRVHEMDPMFTMIPYIMRSRTDSQVMFEEKIDLSNLKEFLKKQRIETMPSLSTLHVMIAAMIRTISQKPRINRFVSGGNVYARNYLRVSMAVKKQMSEDGDEAIVMPVFEPTDTLAQVVDKLNRSISEADFGSISENGTDMAVKILGALPGFIKSFIVALMSGLDSIGKMPKIINQVSPFHSSLFVTNVGSLGIGSVYHHLYKFGTTSIFMALGKKETERKLDSNGETILVSYITLRFVVDERICDGYYYATAIKLFKWYLNHPELLLVPPETVVEDI